MLVWQRVRSPPLRIFKRFYFPPPSPHFLRRLPFFLFFSACGRTSVVVGFFCLFAPFFPFFPSPLPICGKTGAAVFPPPLYIACYEKTAERGKRRRRKEWRGEEEERELFLLVLVFLSVSRIVREEIRPLKKETFESLDHKMHGRSNI